MDVGHGGTRRGRQFLQIGLATERLRAIDLSCRACGAGAGRWAWIPGWGLRSAPVFTPNLRLIDILLTGAVRSIPHTEVFRKVFRKVFRQVFRNVFPKIGCLKKNLAQVVDLVPLGTLFGPGAPDADLGHFQIEV